MMGAKHNSEGCTNKVCTVCVIRRYGAKVKLCSSEGCTNHVILGGLCIRHGAKMKL